MNRRFNYAKAFSRGEMVLQCFHTQNRIDVPHTFGALLDVCLNYIYEQVPVEPLFWLEPKVDVTVHKNHVEQIYATFFFPFSNAFDALYIRETYENDIPIGVFTQFGFSEHPCKEVLCVDQVLTAYRRLVTS